MNSLTEDYRVQLSAYAGPLDLLLHLVKRHEIDLHDIPIAELTEQYLEHLRLLKTIDVDLAGEFLVMAATLLEIKSRMLVPHVMEDAEEAVGEENESSPVDPRHELVQQLLAYKQYKDAAIDLEQRQRDWAMRPPAHAVASSAPQGEDAAPVDFEMDDVHVLDLCEAFARILDSIGQAHVHEVSYDDTPLSLHAEDICDRLKRDGAMTLQRMFEGRSSRSEMVGLFLALLELVRQWRVKVVQDKPGEAIQIDLRDPNEAAAEPTETMADLPNPQTGEVEYDWPDEQSRATAERRRIAQQNHAAGMQESEKATGSADSVEFSARGVRPEEIAGHGGD